MHPVLALIGDLYTQIQMLQKEVEDLKAEKADLELATVGKEKDQ